MSAKLLVLSSATIKWGFHETFVYLFLISFASQASLGKEKTKDPLVILFTLGLDESGDTTPSPIKIKDAVSAVKLISILDPSKQEWSEALKEADLTQDSKDYDVVFGPKGSRMPKTLVPPQESGVE